MTLNIENEVDVPFTFDYKKIISDVVAGAMAYEQCPYEAEINVVLTSDDEIAVINRDYRNQFTPTDVLSFPMIDYDTPGNFDHLEHLNVEDYFNPETGELILGDIIISVEKVVRQADMYGHSQQRELGFLVAHSMLHLFGYDHMALEEAAVMETKQREILDALGLERGQQMMEAKKC